jgi:predicted GIY-YIG superfamily endonuclease
VSAAGVYYVYILASRRHGMLYIDIGICNDLANRLTLHRSGRGSQFVKKYGVTRLVYVETYDGDMGVSISHRRQHLAAAIVRIKLPAALPLDRSAASGGGYVLRDGEAAGEAVGAAPAFAGGESGAGDGDADDEQESGCDFDQQSHGVPLSIVIEPPN